jgi:cytochrome b involved in lipid metabolism
MADPNKAKRVPKEYPKRRYYIPANVAKHNTPHDFWVSLFNRVYDLTPLFDENVGNP